MSTLDDHPTVLAVRDRPPPPGPPVLEAEALRALCLEAGADDVGFVSIGRAEMDAEREDVLRVFPGTRTLIAFVRRMNPESIRSPARNVANHEFHATGDETNEIARRIVAGAVRLGARAVNPPMAFPMEMDRFPGKVWTLSLKPLAVAAGLGHMGLHRNVIHPRFGSFVLLGAVLTDAAVSDDARPTDFNPCLTCKLCVAACPVGAIAPEGAFNFASCFTHNYREFMGGFTDWVESVAGSKRAADYRARVTDDETASMWQSLSFGANYKAAYCVAVCPAGEDLIAPLLRDRQEFLNGVVRPLQEKEEPVYVQPGSDAEAHVRRRFPHKNVRRVGAVLRPTTVKGFVRTMRHAFQPGRAKGLAATYHFRFTGAERVHCTVAIREQAIEVSDGLTGRPDLRVTADSRAWLRLLRKEAGIAWLVLTFRVRLWGDPRLLAAFGRCFP